MICKVRFVIDTAGDEDTIMEEAIPVMDLASGSFNVRVLILKPSP
jgi:hypothetical protein